MLQGLSDVIGGIGEDVGNFITSKPFASAAVGVSALGAGAFVLAKTTKRRAKTKKKAKTTKKRKTTRKTKGRKLKFGSPAYRKKYLGKGKKKRKTTYARTAGKRKDTSTRRIRQTKNGQPYIILASGRPRFIKKSSARLSRKRKGGRY